MNNDIHSGNHVKKIVFKGAWYFLSSILVKALGLIMMPLITKYMSTTEFGVISGLDSIRLMIPIIISLCIDDAYYRFYHDYNQDKEKLAKFVSTIFWFIIIWGIVVTIISMIIGYLYLDDLFNVPFHPFISITLLSSLLHQVKLLGDVYHKQNLKAEIGSLIQTVSILFYYSLYFFFLVGPKIGPLSKIYGIFISDFVVSLVYIFILLRAGLIRFTFDFSVLKKSLIYSIPLLPNELSYWATGLSDRIILGVYKTFSITGVYTIGYILGQTVSMFSNSVFAVYRPMIFSMFTKDKANARIQVTKFIPVYLFAAIWFTTGLCLFNKEFLTLLITNKEYALAYKIVPIIAFAYFFMAIYKTFYDLLRVQKKTFIISIGAVIQSVTNLILNLIFIPYFDQMAAAYSTLVSYIVFFLWIFYFSRRYEPVKIDWFKNIGIFGMALLSIIISSIVMEMYDFSIFMGIGIKSLIAVIFIAMTFATGILKINDFKIES